MPLAAGGDLEGFALRRLRRHTSVCARCREELRAWRLDRSRLASVGESERAASAPDPFSTEAFFLEIRRELRR